MLKNEKNRGITLIALVVTIIVLLILATVSIAMLTGDNGILTNASKVSTSNAYKSAEEQVKLAYMAVKAEISAKTVKSGTYNPAESAETIALATIVANDLGANQTGSKWTVDGSTAGTIQITYTDSKIDKGTVGVVDGVAVPKEEGKVEYKIILHKSQDATLYTDTAGGKLAVEVALDVAEIDKRIKTATDENNEAALATAKAEKVSYYSNFYGKVVDYQVEITTAITYDSATGTEDQKINKGQWKIFYADENNIYLIADSRVAVRNLDGTATNTIFNGNGTTSSNGYIIESRWTARFGSNNTNGIFPKYTLTDGVVNYSRTNPTQITKYASLETLKNLNKAYYDAGYGTSTKGGGADNARAVASMLDTDVWSIYMDNNYAQYVIGGPSVEMFCNSYSQTHAEGAGLQTQAYANGSTYGYIVWNATKETPAWYWASGGGSVVAYSSSDTTTINKLYRPNNNEHFWLSSPSIFDSNNVMLVYCDDGSVSVSRYNSSRYGFRPIVCLKSDVQLVEASQAKKDQGIDFELR